MSASPRLITPDPGSLLTSSQELPLQPLVDGTASGNLPGASSGVGWTCIPPGRVAAPHLYRSTWVYFLLWSAGALGAITLYGDGLSSRIYQQPGQLLVIPPGTPRAVANPNPSCQVVAYMFHSNASISLDNIVREDLRATLDRQIPALFDVNRTADTT